MLTNTELTFKKNLIHLRKSKELSMKKLAELLEIDDAYYRKLENLNKSVAPRFATLEKIAKFYNIPVSQLFQEAND